MQILKGYVFRLYPNKEQAELINKTIGCSRFIYNYFLDDKIKEYKIAGKSKSAYDQIKLIPSLSKEKPWLKEVDSCALRNSLFNLDNAYKNLYNGSGYPRFKAKGLNENPISEIIRVLKYKANWNNKKLIQIDRYYPSSQICSVCDYQNKKVKDLKIRNWECPNCHTKHNRDYNAAVNIMFKGLEKYMKGIEQGI